LRKASSKIEKAEDIEEFGRELGLTTAKEYISYFFPQQLDKEEELFIRELSVCN
jgi:hypothetical protein